MVVYFFDQFDLNIAFKHLLILNHLNAYNIKTSFL